MDVLSLACSQKPMTELLSKDHTILEKGFMEFRPFGLGASGEKTRDVAGTTVRANVEYLEECMSRAEDPAAGARAVEELCRLLNERIRDRTYHVTPKFLKNPWNSYSYEFVIFLAEFCERISGNQQFQVHVGRNFISPLIQTLGRPFTVSQIYRMFPHFGDKFVKDSVSYGVEKVTDRSAVLRMKFTDHVYQQFGPYRKACTELVCQCVKAALASIPERVHHLHAAEVKDVTCIAEGAEYCQWEFTWTPQAHSSLASKVRAFFAGHVAAPIPAQAGTGQESLGRPSAGAETLHEATPESSQERKPAAMHQPTVELLSKDHTILERPFMEFRPFGVNPDGTKIRDATGVKVRAFVDYLEECMDRTLGPGAGERAVQNLCRRLNERIPDSAYHVTPEFLKNIWNSYSYEFVCFLGELCKDISGDPHFPAHVGEEKFISSVIQTLGRPFSLEQIFRMFPHFGEKFSCLILGVGEVTDHSAILSMRYPESVSRQFGPYRKACVELVCQSAKNALATVPEKIHHVKRAVITDLQCVAKGDECCEWEFTWEPQERLGILWRSLWLLAGGGAFAWLQLHHPGMSTVDALLAALPAALAGWLGFHVRLLKKRMGAREDLVQEQLQAVDARHEELREAYLEQEQITVELRRKVAHLTTLHRAGLLFSSTLDREALLQAAIRTLVQDLHYDRAKISMYDSVRQVLRDSRVLGVSEEVAAWIRTLEIPVTDPESMEGTVLLQGKPLLLNDVREVWDRLHPINRQLVEAAKVTSVIAVPLKVKDRVIGTLTVDRSEAHGLTQDDLDLMVTVASQVAIALDNADAYAQIEALNVGLEAKVNERTTELKTANEKLRELDLLKSAFVSIVSHELRTPMTSIKGYVENLLDGLGGPLAEKQAYYLERVKYNTERLTRMTNELLDLSRIEAGCMKLRLSTVSLLELASEVVESFQSIVREKSIIIRQQQAGALPVVQGDRDKLNQVLTNLIQNAIKFSPSHTEVLVKLQLRDDMDCVEVCVVDQGCGIHPSELDKVFDKFYRGESVPIETKGAGLGLSIAKSLIELHGGTIWVTSTPGAGSRFSFTLPVLPPSS